MGSTQPSRDTRSPSAVASFAQGAPSLPPSNNTSFQSRYTTSPSVERRSFDTGSPPRQPGQGLRDGSGSGLPVLVLRRLPASINQDTLQSMMLFADDCQTVRFIDLNDESGWQSAVAEFRTVEGANEARHRLNGKRLSNSGAPIVVDFFPQSTLPSHNQNGDYPVDGLGIRRQLSNAAASRGHSMNGPRQSSRYFQSMGEKVNAISIPPHQTDSEDAQNLFSPRSPHATGFRDTTRQTGKSMISEDADDETGELLKDPVAYARGSHSGGGVRRSNSAAQPPVSRMNGLSLNTGQHSTSNGTMMSPTLTGGYGGGRNMPQGAISPTNELPNPLTTNGLPPVSPTNTGYPISPTHVHQRHLPPANPADQNPPCNTLYVGNLPIDTSEDELKAIFSKQRGYKRLCFRTKHNGPMCFVEFEDVSFATKALNELYGHTLHNSVKGGIRLSFSKNPLGVRTGQANSLNPGSPLGSPGSAGGFGGPGAFSGVSGPPPGLAMPPGLASPPLSAGGPAAAGGGGGNGGGFNNIFGPNSPPVNPTAQSRNQYGGYFGATNMNNIGAGQ